MSTARPTPRHPLSGTVYGRRFEGDLPAPFARHLHPVDSGDRGGDGGGRGTVTVTFRPVSRRQLLAEAGDLAAETGADATAEDTPEGCLWQSEPGGTDTLGRFTRAGRPDHFRLAAWGPRHGLFDVRPRSIDLAWAASGGGGRGGGDGAAEAAHHLFAYAVPLWLETRGVPVLHGSAVTLGAKGRLQAVGFLGPSGTGKSVLCAELVRQGAGFLADDGLALELDPGADAPSGPGGGPGGGDGPWRCLAGPPLLRLWPSGLDGRLDLAAEALPRIRAEGDKRHLAAADLGAAGGEAEGGAFASRPPALAALYLLRRRPGTGGGVELSPRSPRQALFRFLEHGVAASPAAALGLEEGRLQTLARLAEAVPLRELSFPSGADSAAAVGDALERDLQRLVDRHGLAR